MKSYLPLIIGMTFVTYLPRLIPLLTIVNHPLHPIVKRFLLYIPYTALSSLIVHGMMQSPSNMRLATLVGLSAAGICSWVKGSVALSVLISIFAAVIILQI